MPMKLNVGVSRKIGLPDYGSVGASCNLELELESALLERDLQAFHTQIRGAYVAAHQAVQDELARLQDAMDPGARSAAKAPSGSTIRNGDATENGNGHGTRPPNYRSRIGKAATPNQLKAIMAIASRQGIDLTSLLRQDFHVERPEDLTLKQASELIDLLKNAPRT
ncbi:MAG: hypothetical protein ACLP7Q_10110 [Isosphaeraceae bacterium]